MEVVTRYDLVKRNTELFNIFGFGLNDREKLSIISAGYSLFSGD